MSTYIISDIHGNNTQFRRALKAVKLKKSDTLILLGDLIDRGEESKEVLDTIFLLQKHDFNIILLMGNHEDMFLDSLNNFSTKVNWLRNGGDKTLSSFLTSDIKGIPKEYIELIEKMKLFYEKDNFIFVHAGLNMTIQNPFEDKHSILWLRKWQEYFNSDWLGNRIIIHGHNPTHKDDILKQFAEKKNVLCIDNGSYLEKPGYGAICVLRLEDLSLKFIN